MTWRRVGSLTVTASDDVLTVGPLSFSPNDGIQVRVVQTSPVSVWKYSYGLLWVETIYGRDLGTIKVYGHTEGADYRLGAGLSSLLGDGVLKFSPRLWNRKWLQASGETWGLQFWADEPGDLPTDRYEAPGFQTTDKVNIPVVLVGTAGRLSF